MEILCDKTAGPLKYGLHTRMAAANAFKLQCSHVFLSLTR